MSSSSLKWVVRVGNGWCVLEMGGACWKWVVRVGCAARWVEVEEKDAPVIGVVGIFDLGAEDVDVVPVCKLMEREEKGRVRLTDAPQQGTAMLSRTCTRWCD
jgi:hypothetical protein